MQELRMQGMEQKLEKVLLSVKRETWYVESNYFTASKIVGYYC